MNTRNDIDREDIQATGIVAAYNEEATIYNVVQTLSMHLMIDRVIVIDDGLTDTTSFVLDAFSSNPHVEIITLEKNKGKGNALALGVEHAQDGLLVFVDADIINLTKHHIYGLIEPLLNDKADMVLGYLPSRSHALELVFGCFKWLTGQRALRRKDILPFVDAFRTAGYGVETIINHAMRQRRVHLFELNGLHHVLKFDRWSLPVSAQKYLREGMEIAGTMFPAYLHEIKDGIINRFRPSNMN